MRILQLCLSHGHGGLELHVARLCTLLRAEGLDCRALAAPGTRLAKRLATDPALPLTLFTTRVSALPLLAAWRLARRLDEERIDIVHVHWSRDLALAALAKRFCRYPVRLVHSRHMRITRPKRDAYHRFLYRSLDCLVVLGERMHAEALRFLPIDASRIEIIHLGVPGPAPEILARSAQRPDSATLMIGLFGRIEAPKGQHLLVEAVDRLRGQGIDARARIIGHAMDTIYLEDLKRQITERGLDDRIALAGFIDDPIATMPDFDVIVLATRHETFGLVLVEAMRCGVAVVGSNAGGVPEIIEHEQSGLLFEPESAEALAQQLHRLAEDPALRRRLAEGGRQRADRLFSEERHVAQVVALYRSLLPS